jgi:DNA-binding beta-propeller fold protein YncE
MSIATRCILLVMGAGLAVAPAARAEWLQPGFAFEWSAGTTYGFGSDGDRRIFTLNQPPVAYDTEGRSLGPFGQNLTDVAPLHATLAVARAPNGHLFVRNIGQDISRAVVELDANDRFVRRFPLPAAFETVDGHYDYRGIAVDDAGRLHLAAVDPGEIRVFAPDGTHLATWGSSGSGPGQLSAPYRLAFGPDGTLFVADRGNGRIQRIRPDGTFLAPLAPPDARLLDLAFDRAGNLYAVAADQGIRVYDPDLVEIGRWNERAPGIRFQSPGWVALDANDNVYVADRHDDIIAKYDTRLVVAPPAGQYSPKLVLTALPAPQTTHVCETVRHQALEAARTSAGLVDQDPQAFYFVCLVVARGTGSFLAGLQCGVDYPDEPSDASSGSVVEVFDWHLCADLEFPTPAGTPAGAPAWPGPGSGNLITWDPIDNCQRLDLAVAGYFYVGAYAAATFQITKRPVDDAAKVAYCATSGEVGLTKDDLGFVSFSAGGLALGCNPVLAGCAELVAVRPTTWSAIKSMLR